ncbi:MAG TPA: ATPase domain-containing protein [Gemmatimonadales bacterium]|nr:ATPase domain-containing protein [Gemmatimonadales bacterium]
MPDQPRSPSTAPKGAGALLSIGVPGLDFVLGGGLPEHRVYLIEGTPGTGKTTLALQFLLEGAARGETTLYITLAETRQELEAVAGSHGWKLDDVEIVELAPPDEILNPESRYTVFHPSDVELNQTARSVYDAVERLRPSRVVLDSLSEMRILSQEPLRLRRQVLALKHFFTGRGCTVLLLDDERSQDSALHFASIVHGVILLEQLALEYGAERRRARVTKLRGQRFRGGYHDFTIRTGGLAVYPRLVASEHPQVDVEAVVSSGNKEIDLLLGGGLDAGTCTLLMGPTGVGKTVLTTEIAVAAARRGERAILFLFDERVRTFTERARKLNLGMDEELASGWLVLQQIDPTELSPGAFAARVVETVEREGSRMVGIDSLTGYLNAMPAEQLLNIHLHELFSYLGQRGVTSMLTLAQHAPFSESSVVADLSYLADAIILLRYFEAIGEVRQAISIIKRRSGAHEKTIREYRIRVGGLKVGAPLHEFQGVLGGTPEYLGPAGPLLGRTSAGDPNPA